MTISAFRSQRFFVGSAVKDTNFRSCHQVVGENLIGKLNTLNYMYHKNMSTPGVMQLILSQNSMYTLKNCQQLFFFLLKFFFLHFHR